MARAHGGPSSPSVRRPGFSARFAVGSLATWRLTHLLAEEDGPAQSILRLRAKVGPSPLGELMDCFYCLSLWVAAPISCAVAMRKRDLPSTWLGLAGAACLLERMTHGRELGEKSLGL
jgi:hypothetical protein